MKYKVVKEFGSLKKGDILENSEDPQFFTLEEESDNVYRYISLSDTTVEAYVKDDYLAEVIEDDEDEELLNIISEAVDQIDEMIKQYDEDNALVTDKFSKNEIPYCAKVEADTVHYNLKKALNKIKSILINE